MYHWKIPFLNRVNYYTTFYTYFAMLSLNYHGYYYKLLSFKNVLHVQNLITEHELNGSAMTF